MTFLVCKVVEKSLTKKCYGITEGRTDGMTDRCKPVYPPLFQSGGIINECTEIQDVLNLFGFVFLFTCLEQCIFVSLFSNFQATLNALISNINVNMYNGLVFIKTYFRYISSIMNIFFQGRILTSLKIMLSSPAWYGVPLSKIP